MNENMRLPEGVLAVIERLNAADDKFYHYAEKGSETQK